MPIDPHKRNNNNKGFFNKLFGFFKSSKKSKHGKDYSWKKSKKNPYKRDDDGGSLKPILLLILAAVAIIGTIGMLLFHPFFQIKNLNVSGLQKISKQDFKSSVRGIYSYKKYFIVPANNYFLLDKKEIKNILKDKYPIDSIAIKKEFSDTLNLTVQEKVSTIIYDNGNKYAYIGLDGNVIEVLRKVGDNEWKKETKMVTTTTKDGKKKREEKIISKTHIPPIDSIKTEMGKYPIIYDKRGNKKIEVNNTVMTQKEVESVVNWYQLLKNNSRRVNFKYGSIGTSTKDFIVHTDSNWNVKANLDNKVKDQFYKLKYLLDKRLKNKSNISYINVKYKDRVYWK